LAPRFRPLTGRENRVRATQRPTFFIPRVRHKALRLPPATRPARRRLSPLTCRRRPHHASAPAAPIRTNTAAPPVAPRLPAASHVFLSPAVRPDSPAHPRRDAAKATEIAVFDSIDCKTAIPAHSVPAGRQIFHYLWRVTHKPNRVNGKPAERARYCIAGNHDLHKSSIVSTSPVTPQCAIRAVFAASVILRFTLHSEDFLRAYLQSDRLDDPVYAWAPPEAGLPYGTVWKFQRAMYGKNDSGHHFHLNTQSRFLTIPDITLSSAFDTI